MEFNPDEEFEGISHIDLSEYIDVIHEHSENHEGCKQVSMKIKRRSVNPSVVVKVEDVMLVNGEHPKIGDTVVCGSCGVKIDLLSVQTFLHCIAVTLSESVAEKMENDF